MKSIAIGLIFFLSSAAHAVDWKVIGASKEEKLYLDMDTLRTINGNRRGWFMTSYSKGEDMSGVYLKSYLHLVEVDCAEGKMRILAAVMKEGEMGSGETVGGFDKSDAAKWIFIVPGTAGEYQSNILCKKSSVR